MLAFGGVKIQSIKKKLQQKPPKCLQFFKFHLYTKPWYPMISVTLTGGEKKTPSLSCTCSTHRATYRHLPVLTNHSGFRRQKKKKKSSDFWVAKFGANKKKLFGGFLPPLWKICSSKMGIFRSSRGENQKYLKPPPRKKIAGRRKKEVKFWSGWRRKNPTSLYQPHVIRRRRKKKVGLFPACADKCNIHSTMSFGMSCFGVAPHFLGEGWIWWQQCCQISKFPVDGRIGGCNWRWCLVSWKTNMENEKRVI